MEGFPYGLNLSVIIKCRSTPYHDQLAFSCWYSLQENLADANVGIAIAKADPKQDLYRWAYRMKIPVMYYKDDLVAVSTRMLKQPTIITIPEMVFLSSPGTFSGIQEAVGHNAKEDDDCDHPIISIEQGCGRWNPEKWINGGSFIHLPYIEVFRKSKMTRFEDKVLSMWIRMTRLYGAIV